MALDRLTKVDGRGISTTSDYRVGIITASKFVGPIEGTITSADATFTGNVSIAGTLTYEDVTNVDSVGVITARNGIKVSTGTATTALVVDGDARVTGILTVGTSSLKLDGPNNVVNVGTALTLGHSQGVQFHTQNLHSAGFEVNQINASGIITATGADINGDIDVDGHTNLDNVSVAGVTTMSGNLTISNTDPRIIFVDTNNNPDFTLHANDGAMQVENSGTGTQVKLESSGSTRLFGNVIANKDLDVDGHTNLDNVSISGVTTITSTAPELHFTDTNADSDYSIIVNSGRLRFRDRTNSNVDRFYITSDGSNYLNGDVHLGEIFFGTGSRTRVYSGGGTHVKNALMVTNPSATVTGRGAGVALCGVGQTNDYIGTLYVRRSALGDNRGTTYLEAKDDIIIKTNAATSTVTAATFDTSGRLYLGPNSTGGNGDVDDLVISGTGKKGITVCSTDGGETRLVFADGLSGTNAVVGQVLYDHSANRMDFYTSTNRRASINTHGFVGINSITPSTYLTISATGNQRQDMLKLQHQGQRTFYIQGQWGSTDIGGSNGILQYVDGGGIAFRSGATGAAGMIVSQANKVGIHTNEPSVNLHANMAVTTNSSLSWGANCGQIFRNEGSELAFGLQNTAPYPYYLQARTSASTARQLAINPRGGAVSVNTINSFSRAFTVKGQVGVISPNQTAAMDMSIDDSGNFEIGAYHTNGGTVTLKTAPAGLGNQTRLNINKDGQLTHTTNKSSQYTAKFVQAHADNPAWIEIDSPQDNNLRPAYIQFKNAGNDKWGIGQVYNPTAGQSFHICEGTQNNSNSHFVIKSNNYVGINTNNPQSALHVRGGGGIRIDTLSGTPIASNSNVITDGGGNPIISGTPWYMAHTYQWQGSYSGMGYYWIKVVKSLGNSAIGYIDYMAHGDSNYPRHCRGTIAIAKYANGSISCCHDQQTHEGGGNIQVKLCGDGTVWIRLHAYDWNSDFRFRLVYGEDVTLNTDFTATGNSDNSYGRIDTRGGGHPVNASNEINPGANVRYSVSGNSFNPAGSNASYGNDDHRFFRINCMNQLTKGSGSFRIDHPLAGMSTSHYLQHSFVEGPQADNIYRGKTTLVAGISTVNIDTVSNMTDGTFVELNTDVQCFTTNETGWTPIKGSVSGNKLTILAQDNSCTDTISWMVVGERQDDHIKNKADWTDSDGKVIVELPKRNVGFAGTEAPYDEYK